MKSFLILISILLFNSTISAATNYMKEVNIHYLNMEGVSDKDFRSKIDTTSLKKFSRSKKNDFFIVTGLKNINDAKFISLGIKYPIKMYDDKNGNVTTLILGINNLSIRPKVFRSDLISKNFQKKPLLFKIGRSFGIITLDFERVSENGKKEQFPTISQYKELEDEINGLLAQSKLLKPQIIIVGNFGKSSSFISKFLRGYTYATKEGSLIKEQHNGKILTYSYDNIMIPDRSMQNIVKKGLNKDFVMYVANNNNKEENPFKVYKEKISKHILITLKMKIMYKK